MTKRLAQKVARRTLRCADEERDIPKTVKRYVEEHKEQGMEESKAWAIAWSRYCRYTNPDSPRCKKDPDEYFSGRDSSLNRVAFRIADRVTDKTMAEYVDIDGVKFNKDTLRRRNDENVEKAKQLAAEGRHIKIRFQYVDNDPDKNNCISIVDSGGQDYSVTPIPLEALDFVNYLETWTAEDAEQAQREVEQRSSRLATELEKMELTPKQKREDKGKEIAEEYAKQQVEKGREITLRFQNNESGKNTQLEVEDSHGPGGAIVPIPDDLAILARTVDYWFANPGGVEDTDIERHITEMKGKEYKPASLAFFNDAYRDRGIAGRIAGRVMKAYRFSLPSTLHDKIREYTSKLSQKALRPFPTDDPTQFKYRMIRHLKQEISPFLPDDVDLTEDALDRLISDLIREGRLEITQDLMERAYGEVIDEQLDQVDAGLIGQLQSQLNDMTEEAADDVVNLPSMKSAVRLLKKLGISEYGAQQVLDEMVKRLEINIPFDDQQIDSLVNSLLD